MENCNSALEEGKGLDNLSRIMKLCDGVLEERKNQDKRSPRLLEYVLDHLPSRPSAFLELMIYIINTDFIDPPFMSVGDLISIELTNDDDEKRHIRLNILHLFADRHRKKSTGNISFIEISNMLVEIVRRMNNFGIFDNDICKEQFVDDKFKYCLCYNGSLPKELENLRDYYKYDAENVKNERTEDTIVQLLLAASTVKNKMDLLDMCKIANIDYLSCDHYIRTYPNADLTIITFALLFNKYISDDKAMAIGVFEKANTVPMY